MPRPIGPTHLPEPWHRERRHRGRGPISEPGSAVPHSGDIEWACALYRASSVRRGYRHARKRLCGNRHDHRSRHAHDGRCPGARGWRLEWRICPSVQLPRPKRSEPTGEEPCPQPCAISLRERRATRHRRKWSSKDADPSRDARNTHPEHVEFASWQHALLSCPVAVTLPVHHPLTDRGGPSALPALRACRAAHAPPGW